MSFNIPIAAALVRRADGRMLLVRKRGAFAYMQPGDKIEQGEEPIDALIRELREEIGLSADKRISLFGLVHSASRQ